MKSYIRGDLVQSVRRGEELVRTLAPAQIDAINRDLVKLKG